MESQIDQYLIILILDRHGMHMHSRHHCGSYSLYRSLLLQQTQADFDACQPKTPPLRSHHDLVQLHGLDLFVMKYVSLCIGI